jgi:hypothetical protein
MKKTKPNTRCHDSDARAGLDKRRLGSPTRSNTAPKKARLTGLVLLILLAAPAHAEDARLAELRGLLAPMQAVGHHDDTEMRGATPELMTVKHRLRDWIESRLVGLEEDGDEQAFAAQLNDALRRAELFCRSTGKDAPDRCAERDNYWDATGFLRPIRLDRQQGMALAVRTTVGILCGSDDSAYVYEWRHRRWQRLWQSEEAIERGKDYEPQVITGVRVSWPDKATKRRLVLSLGHWDWCTSNFHPVVFRLWRVAPTGAKSELLVDEAPFAYFGVHDPPIEGSVGKNDALVEFTTVSLDINIFSYETVRHFKIAGAGVKRVDPIALSPRNFTEEWLKGDWAESATWSVPARRPTLQSWHAKAHSDHSGAQYVGAPGHCTKNLDLWQVGIDFSNSDKSLGVVYFLVRWQPPYHFEMVDVTTTPRADCNRTDEPGGALDTLFPIQDWR